MSDQTLIDWFNLDIYCGNDIKAFGDNKFVFKFSKSFFWYISIMTSDIVSILNGFINEWLFQSKV